MNLTELKKEHPLFFKNGKNGLFDRGKKYKIFGNHLLVISEKLPDSSHSVPLPEKPFRFVIYEEKEGILNHIKSSQENFKTIDEAISAGKEKLSELGVFTGKVKTDNKWHAPILGYELSAKERKDFEWLDSEKLENSEFIRYSGSVYYLGDFTILQNSGDWHAGFGTSAWSGIYLQKKIEHGEAYYKVGLATW